MQSSLRQHVNQLFVTNYYVVNKHEGGGREREGEGGWEGEREGVDVNILAEDIV